MNTFPQLTPKRIVLGLAALLLLFFAFSIVRDSFAPVFGTSQNLMFLPSQSDSSSGVAVGRATIAVSKGGYAVSDEYNGSEGMMAPSVSMPAPMPATAPQGDSKIIRSANLSLLVDNVDRAVTEIGKIRVAQGGAIGDANMSEYRPGVRTGFVTIWVPSERFDATISALKTLALRVENESVSVTDVSTPYVDTQARLKNLRATEEQYQSILKRTGSITEVLAVTKELSSVRGEIERTQAELGMLARRVELSSITIQLSQEDVPASVATEWRPLSVAKTALKSLLADLVDFANASIVFIIRLPLLVIEIGFWVLVFWGLWKGGRMMYRKLRTASSSDSRGML